MKQPENQNATPSIFNFGVRIVLIFRSNCLRAVTLSKDWPPRLATLIGRWSGLVPRNCFDQSSHPSREGSVLLQTAPTLPPPSKDIKDETVQRPKCNPLTFFISGRDGLNFLLILVMPNWELLWPIFSSFQSRVSSATNSSQMSSTHALHLQTDCLGRPVLTNGGLAKIVFLWYYLSWRCSWQSRQEVVM